MWWSAIAAESRARQQKAFSEIYRILKPGGHFHSDVVIQGELPDSLRNDAEMYAGCVAGAILKDEYLDLIRQTGIRHPCPERTSHRDPGRYPVQLPHGRRDPRGTGRPGRHLFH
ncbi:MAG: hypothetical protein R2787_06765 [Saprospiraceae bacterium]